MTWYAKGKKHRNPMIGPAFIEWDENDKITGMKYYRHDKLCF